MVQRLAQPVAARDTGNSSGLAARRLEGVLEVAIFSSCKISEANLRRVLSAYVTYYNRWRPHRALGQAPCGEVMSLGRQACRKIAAAPVLGGLHHIYWAAAQ